MPDENIVAETPEAPAAEAAPTRTFSPDDVERIVRERLERERKKYDGFDAIKAKAEEFDKVQLANMSEIERVKAEAKAEADRAAALEAELGGMKRVGEQRALLVEMGFAPAAIENLAGRLAGEDATGWKADADKFAALMTAQAAAPPAANNLDPKGDEVDPITAALRS